MLTMAPPELRRPGRTPAAVLAGRMPPLATAGYEVDEAGLYDVTPTPFAYEVQDGLLEGM